MIIIDCLRETCASFEISPSVDVDGLQILYVLQAYIFHRSREREREREIRIVQLIMLKNLDA